MKIYLRYILQGMRTAYTKHPFVGEEPEGAYKVVSRLTISLINITVTELFVTIAVDTARIIIQRMGRVVEVRPENGLTRYNCWGSGR